MPIQCRTGCGEQLNYEDISFPDGFIYFLPKNMDGTIHDCSNLPKESTSEGWSPEEKEISKLKYSPDFHEKREEIEISFQNGSNQLHREYESVKDNLLNEVLENDELPENERKSEYEIWKKMLINTQIRCNLFPTPFMSDPAFFGYSDLKDLSKCYEEVKDYESAIIARLIQDRITHDQGKKLMELEFLKNKIPVDKETKTTKSVIEIRDKYIRNLEGIVKEFLRKYYLIKDFKESDPEFFLKLNEHREERNKRRTITVGKFDDVYERLTLGQCLTIIRKQKKREKKDGKFSMLSKIDNVYLGRLEWIVENFRNEHDHAVEDVEREFSEYDKALSVIYTDTIIDHLDKLTYI